MDKIKILYKNQDYEYQKGVSLLEVSKDFALDFKNDIIYAKVDDKYQELNYILKKDVTVEFYDCSSLTGSRIYGNGILFLLMVAVHQVLKSDIAIKHSLDKGIYCEVLTKKSLGNEELDQIIDCMKEIVDKKIPFKPIHVNRVEAIKMYEKKGMLDKANSLRYISNSYIKLYYLEDECDYFYSDMPINTSYLKDFELSLVNEKGIVINTPNIYKNNKIMPYIHRKKIFDGFKNYSNWSNNQYGINYMSDLNRYVSESKAYEIIRASEAYYSEQLSMLTTQIVSNKKVKVILIAGASSSGKTTTATRIAELLKVKGLNPHVISTDDYFIPLAIRPLDENGNPDMESLKAVDTTLFNKDLQKLLEGKEVEIPSYNFILCDREYKGNYITLGDNDVLIVEGIHALNDKLTKAISDDVKYRVYLFPMTILGLDNHNRIRTTDNRLIRRIVRDNATRALGVTETLKKWKDIRDGEEKHVFPFQGEADYIVNTSLLYEFGVLKTYAEPLLFTVKEDDPNYSEAIRLINLFRNILPIPSEKVPADSILREFIGGSCFK